MDTAEMGDNSVDEIEYDELQSLLDDLSDKQRHVTEATGGLRARLKAILDEKGWNKSALGMIRQIENKSETARADFLRTFEPMFDAMVSKKWRDEMHDMIDETNTERVE